MILLNARIRDIGYWLIEPSNAVSLASLTLQSTG